MTNINNILIASNLQDGYDIVNDVVAMLTECDESITDQPSQIEFAPNLASYDDIQKYLTNLDPQKKEKMERGAEVNCVSKNYLGSWNEQWFCNFTQSQHKVKFTSTEEIEAMYTTTELDHNQYD